MKSDNYEVGQGTHNSRAPSVNQSESSLQENQVNSTDTEWWIGLNCMFLEERERENPSK